MLGGLARLNHNSLALILNCVESIAAQLQFSLLSFLCLLENLDLGGDTTRNFTGEE